MLPSKFDGETDAERERALTTDLLLGFQVTNTFDFAGSNCAQGRNTPQDAQNHNET